MKKGISNIAIVLIAIVAIILVVGIAGNAEITGAHGWGGDDGGKWGKKVTICHVPPGNEDNPQTIKISKKALNTHLAHGDYLGKCVKEPIGYCECSTEKPIRGPAHERICDKRPRCDVVGGDGYCQFAPDPFGGLKKCPIAVACDPLTEEECGLNVCVPIGECTQEVCELQANTLNCPHIWTTSACVCQVGPFPEQCLIGYETCGIDGCVPIGTCTQESCEADPSCMFENFGEKICECTWGKEIFKPKGQRTCERAKFCEFSECGDGVCSDVEANPDGPYSCPEDCEVQQTCPWGCGDGICDEATECQGAGLSCFPQCEDKVTCIEDCGVCDGAIGIHKTICGDGLCEGFGLGGDEDCFTCPEDCGLGILDCATDLNGCTNLPCCKGFASDREELCGHYCFPDIIQLNQCTMLGGTCQPEFTQACLPPGECKDIQCGCNLGEQCCAGIVAETLYECCDLQACPADPSTNPACCIPEECSKDRICNSAMICGGPSPSGGPDIGSML